MSFDELFPREPHEDEDDDEFEDDEDESASSWFGPREAELGMAVPQTIVVVRSPRAVVGLSHIVAYSNGATFKFVAQARGVKQSRMNAILRGQHGFDPDEKAPDELLRIGLELADGTRVSDLGARFGRYGRNLDDEPEGPVFHQHGGGGGSGGGGRVTMRPSYWLWPLPPPGPLRIWCEWPALEVELASVEIDAAAIRAAAEKARPLWEAD